MMHMVIHFVKNNIIHTVLYYGQMLELYHLSKPQIIKVKPGTLK